MMQTSIASDYTSVGFVLQNVLTDLRAKNFGHGDTADEVRKNELQTQWQELRNDKNFNGARIVLEGAMIEFPDDISIKVNMGETYLAIGEPQRALTIYESILGQHEFAYSNYMMSCDYCGIPLTERVKPKELPSTRPIPMHWNGQSKIRIGFMTQCDIQHPVGFFLKKILGAIDRDKFQIVLFSDSTTESDFKSSIEALTDFQFDIYDLSNTAVFGLVRRSRIDVLIDCEGHTSGGKRLGLLEMRPCALQIQAIGYPNQTLYESAYDFWAGSDICTHEEGPTAVFQNSNGYCPVFPIRYGTRAPEICGDKIKAVCIATPSKMTKEDAEYFSILIDEYNIDISFFRYGNQYSDEKYEMLKKIDQRFQILEGCSESYCKILNSFDIAIDTQIWSGHTTTIECLSQGMPVLPHFDPLPNCRSKLCLDVYKSIGIEPPAIDILSSKEAVYQMKWRCYDRISITDTTKKWVAELEEIIIGQLKEKGGF